MTMIKRTITISWKFALGPFCTVRYINKPLSSVRYLQPKQLIEIQKKYTTNILQNQTALPHCIQNRERRLCALFGLEYQYETAQALLPIPFHFGIKCKGIGLAVIGGWKKNKNKGEYDVSTLVNTWIQLKEMLRMEHTFFFFP